jgi:hypothetical protein
MSQSLLLKIKGLYTSLNELSEVPEGALLEADNIDILKDSIAEPRRGFERLSAGYSTSTHRTDRTWFYQDKQFAHHGTLGSASTVSFLDAGVWSSVGTFSAPTGYKMRTLTANQNLYFTTSAGEITAGTLTITDIVPDALRGETIYTASSQEGVVNQNEQPPLAKDMAVFRDTVFYANTVSKHRFYLTLLAAGSPNGIQADDTITIGGVAYTGKAAETIASAQFKVFSAGSAAQNVRDTALSLVKVINQYSSSTVYAYYLSGPDDLPGKILLEERSIGGAAFAVISSRTTAWNPTLETSGTDDESTNDTFMNGLSWSKQNQPEAVPLPNQVTVGSKDAEILRIVPLKEALYIFKEDGIFKLTGFYPNFTIELFDSSAILTAPESCAVLNNQIFCLTDQGVTVVSDGVKVISRPIEQDLLELTGASLSGVQTLTWGIGYESERKYYLFMISEAGDTFATQAYVFNVFTNSWVRHVLTATAGVVFENHLYIGDAGSNYILKDRKSYTYLDYADFGGTTSISTISTLTMTLGSNVDLAAVGDILYQSSTVFAVITAVDTVLSTVTVETDPGFSAASAEILKAISTNIKWVPVTTGNPAIQKAYHTASFLFKTDFQGTGYATFSSDLSQYDESVPLAGTSIGAWGLFSWGESPWGGVSLKRPIRQWVPRDKQRASQLIVSFQHAYGFSSWQLQGLSLFGEPGTERIGK